MRILAFTLLASSLLTAGTAAAQDQKATAEALYEDGVKLMKANQYGDACKKFQASEQLDVASGTQLNLAHCLELLGKAASAWAEYKAAAGTARTANDRPRQELAEKAAAALEKEVSRVRVVADAAAGLEVHLDGALLVPAMLNSDLPVDPGEHTLDAKAAGHLPYSTTVTINPHGDQKTITIPALAPEPTAAPAKPDNAVVAPPPPPQPPPTPAQEPPSRSVAPWVIGGVGIAGLAVGGILAGVVAGDQSTARSECNQTTLRCSAAGISASNSVKSLGPVSTVGFIVGGVGVGVSAVWLIARGPAKSKAQSASVGMGPVVTASGGGWRFQGSW